QDLDTWEESEEDLVKTGIPHLANVQSERTYVAGAVVPLLRKGFQLEGQIYLTPRSDKV
ncbi:9516_t:CDS:2, partial [Paraglomus brasilianum]